MKPKRKRERWYAVRAIHPPQLICNISTRREFTVEDHESDYREGAAWDAWELISFPAPDPKTIRKVRTK